MRLALVEAGVQHLVADAFLVEEFDSISDFSIETVPTSTGWPISCRRLDLLGDGAELVGDVLVEFVVLVDALDRDVGRDRDDVHLVDVEEFRRLGQRRAGHARQLRIHAEIVLEGDRGERLVLGLDLDAFLGLDRLVQARRTSGRPSIIRPVNSSMMTTLPSFTM